jgi:hypothetical protein
MSEHYNRIVEILGGEQKFLSLPLIDYRCRTDMPFGDAYIDKVDPQLLHAPITRGFDQHGRGFVCIRYEKDGQVRVETIFQRYIPPETSSWYAIGSHYTNQNQSKWITFGSGVVMDETAFVRLQRLVNGEPCGEFYYDDELSYDPIEDFNRPVRLI